MSELKFINLSGYRFVHLNDLPDIQQRFKDSLAAFGMQGSVMLASEGINVSLAGTEEAAARTRGLFDQDDRFANLWLKETQSSYIPYRRLRIRVRAEIIAFDGQDSEKLQASRPVAESIAPEKLRQWLDESRDFTLLDARNDYEIVSGTFPQSTHLDIKHFRHFKSAVEDAVAAGRLLNYFQTCDAAHWEGECFIFDDRVELTTALKPTGAGLCDHCQLAVPKGTECRCQLGTH